jgi:arginyl-tRNA synthetase
MQTSPNKVNLIPAQLGQQGFCAFGSASEELQQWCVENGLEQQPSGKFTNFLMPDGVYAQDLFVRPEKYKYLDGFSPNLNKHLHLGHLSNLVLAKAFQSMGVAEETVTIFGDTLDGSVGQEEALAAFFGYCDMFDYHVDHLLYASKMKLPDESKWLQEGEGKYEGAKVFDIFGQKMVGIKSGDKTTLKPTGAHKPLAGLSENTTYFYQDMALAATLNAPTLYLTGSEQIEHFKLLKSAFPHIDHIGLGLVLLNGAKLSNRNVDGSEKTEEEKKKIYAKEVLEMLNGIFNDNLLSFNVLAGHILKADPKSTKNIDANKLADPNVSFGLYLSYTTARLKSAGIEPICGEKFQSLALGYAYAKAMFNKAPHTLFNALTDHCMYINSLYKTHRIIGNEKNKTMFGELMMDLELGLKVLGLYSIDKVESQHDSE